MAGWKWISSKIKRDKFNEDCIKRLEDDSSRCHWCGWGDGEHAPGCPYEMNDYEESEVNLAVCEDHPCPSCGWIDGEHSRDCKLSPDLRGG